MAAHPILRTEFRTHDTGFASIVLPEPDRIDIEEIDAISREPAVIQRLYTEYFFRKPAAFVPREMIRTQVINLPFDKSTNGANDVRAIGEEDGSESLLSLSLHHALSDAVSMGAYTDEVFNRYNGDEVPPPGAPEVADYATLVAAADANPATSARGAIAREWWLGHLEGTETVADIPHDLDGHVPLGDQRIGCVRLDYSPMLRTSRALKATPFVLMAALSHVVLARYSGRSEVLSTFQSMGRKGLTDDSVIGPFSNTLILRTRIDEARLLPELITQQRDAIVAALDHEAYPFHMVVRDTGIQPRFALNWFPSHPKPRIVGAKVLRREYFYTQTNYDIDLRFVHNGDEVLVYLYCDSGRYSAGRIDAMLADLSQALKRAVEDPQRRIDTLLEKPGPLIVAPATNLPQGRLHDAFLACARAAPDRIALIGLRGTLTYGQLDSTSAALARRLIGLGIGPGSRVAILAERGTGLVISMLSVLRIGATMVPLDANYPEERLHTLFNVAKPDALILPAPGARPAWAKGVPTLAALDPKATNGPEVDPGALAAGDPDAPAYILFTSGSTGTPKGLATSHRPPLNFLRWQRETFGIGPDDRFTNLNGVAHDMMIRDIFAPLSVGAQLAIPDQADIYRPGRLLEWSMLQRPTVMHLTPAMGNLLAMAREAGPTGIRGGTLPIRVMFFGGDRLLPELTARIAALAPGATIVNFYGATETPQAAAFHVIGDDRPWRAHPIGRGIDNMALRIVDTHHKPAPRGAPGEIAVISPFLSMGYVQGANIVPHATPGVYFTGDTGFELPSGEVMFTGRQDDQVSIRGYRIELEEITRNLLAHPAVRDAQVLVEGGETPRLLAFAVGRDLSDDALYAWLSRRLPHYMVPAEFVCLAALPLLPNGKLDRRALLAAPRPSRARTRGRPPETAMERRLATIWESHLGVAPISPEQCFAELRGDSLSFVQVFLATEAVTGQLPDNWESLPLARIAELAAPPPRFYKWIDSAVLVRAFAIVSVAALHLGVFSFGGGSTSALFMVSGYFIGRLQLAEAFRIRSSRPFWRTFGRVLLPCALYLWIYSGTKLALGLPVHWSIPTFTVDFVNYANVLATGEKGHAIQFWYIGAFLQILVAMALLVHANFWLRLSGSPVRFLAALFAVALVLRFLLPSFIDPGFFTRGLDANSVIAHWPTTQLGTLVLGMMIAQAMSLHDKLRMAVVVAAYAFGTFLISTTSSWAILLLFGLLVLFVPRLPIPKGLHLIILLLSGSSLFIYLTHMQVGGLLKAMGMTEGSFLQWLLVLAAGVLIWLGWQWISGWRSGFQRSVVAQFQSWRETEQRGAP